MASIVICALRDGDAPSAASLGLTRLAREIADRLGATVFVVCALRATDDIERWGAACGRAGADRLAVSTVSASTDESAMAASVAPLVARLRPRLVFVPNEGSTLGVALASALGLELGGDASIGWLGETLLIGDEPFDGQPRVLSFRADEPRDDRGSADIAVASLEHDVPGSLASASPPVSDSP